VEHINRTTSVLGGGQQHGAVAARSVIRPERNVGTEDGSCTTEKVFEILPPDAVGELGWTVREKRRQKETKVTLPTKSWVRVSLGGPERPSRFCLEAVAIWMTASISSFEGGGGGLGDLGRAEAGRERREDWKNPL
jgi:hypothetical protein